jgi:hypothetical protein
MQSPLFPFVVSRVFLPDILAVCWHQRSGLLFHLSVQTGNSMTTSMNEPVYPHAFSSYYYAYIAVLPVRDLQR